MKAVETVQAVQAVKAVKQKLKKQKQKQAQLSTATATIERAVATHRCRRHPCQIQNQARKNRARNPAEMVCAAATAATQEAEHAQVGGMAENRSEPPAQTATEAEHVYVAVRFHAFAVAQSCRCVTTPAQRLNCCCLRCLRCCCCCCCCCSEQAQQRKGKRKGKRMSARVVCVGHNQAEELELGCLPAMKTKEPNQEQEQH